MEEDNSKDKREIESPSYSVDFTDDKDYPQYCRSRITTASRDDGDEAALYVVVFNQITKIYSFFQAG